MPFKVIGDPCNGYKLQGEDFTIFESWHFMKMWDAITARDNLNNGTWKMADTVIVPLEV